MNRPAQHKTLILSFSGLADETLLSFLLKKIEASAEIDERIKSKVCLITVELINNVITHHHQRPFCSYALYRKGKEIILRCENYARSAQVAFVKKRLEQIRKEKNKEEFYFSLLNNTQPGVSRKLGLVRVFRKCGGKITVSAGAHTKKITITLKINAYD